MFIVQARFFFKQLISGVSYCHSMVGQDYSISPQITTRSPFPLFSFSFCVHCMANIAPFHDLWCGQASMPPWFEAREHSAGWKHRASPQDMRLRLFKGTNT